MTMREMLEDLIRKFNAKVASDPALRAELVGLRKTVLIELKDGTKYHFTLADQRVAGLIDGGVDPADIPSGSYPGTPRSPVRHPEIDGSKGPAGCASGPERAPPAIDRGPRAAAFRWGLGFSFRHLRGYPCIRVTKIFLSIPGWLDSDS